MLIFLYGEDNFRSRQKLNEIIKKYKSKHKTGLNFYRLNFAENSFEELKELVKTSPMFAEKKLVVLEGAFDKNADSQKELAGYLKEKEIAKDGDVMLVFWERQTPDKRTELFKFLTKKTNTSQEFNKLSGAKLENWIKREVEKRDGKIEEAAAQRLAVSVGNDLWQMANEIEKLIAFSGGSQTIKSNNIDEMVKAKVNVDIFNTVDVLTKRDKREVLRLLHQHLDRGENELYLMSMFVRQFRNLLIIKDLMEKGIAFYELSKKTGLHPFVVKKTWEQTSGFTLDGLKKIYSKLLDLDLAIKVGKMDSRTALDVLVMGI